MVSHRERVLSAVNHKTSDRLPIDLGGTRVTSATPKAHDALLRHYGLEEKTELSFKEYGIAKISERVQEALDTDIRYVDLWELNHSKKYIISENKTVDAWGVERIKSADSEYYDQLKYPLSGNLTENDLKNYPWPDPNDMEIYNGLRERYLSLKNENDYAINFNFGMINVHLSQFLRGFGDWFMDFIINKKLLSYLLNTILEINMEMCSRALDEIGDNIDMVTFSDDLGTQSGLLISPAHYREFIKPGHKRLFDMVKSKANAKIIYHSCGGVEPLIGDFIDIGVDVLNPVQTSARGMDPLHLKTKYGKDICFHGGIDTQGILRKGTPIEVREHTKKFIDIMGKDGGYILAAAHNIQSDVPVENIIAMFDAVRN